MAAIQHFLSLTDDLICVLDENGLIQDVNANWKRHFQQRVGQDVSLIEMLEENDGDDRLKNFFSNSQMSMLKLKNCRLKDLSGKSYWVDLKIRKIPSQKKCWCLIRDISAKKHNLTVLDQISDTFNFGNWGYESRTGIMSWSEKVYEIFETTPQHTAPALKNFRECFSSEDFNKIDAITNGKFDFTFKAQIDGELKWIHLKGYKETFSDGDYSLQGIIRDVTLEKWREEAQLSNNIELSSFEKGLDQFSIVARTDAKGRIIQANEEFCRISKYKEEELIGKDHRILNSGFHPKEFFTEIWKCIHEGKNWRGEIQNKAKDGSFYWVDTIIIPIRNSHSELVEILSFRFEITHLKKEQRQRQVLENQLSLLMNNYPVPLWSYDVLTEKIEWNSAMYELLGEDARPNSAKFLALLQDGDRDTFMRTLKDPKLHDFSVKIKRSNQNLSVKLKIIRNHLGEAVRLDGICTPVLVGYVSKELEQVV